MKKASLFKPGVNHNDRKKMIEKALQAAKSQGKLKPSDVNNFVYDTGKKIGASNGKEVSKIRLKMDSLGNIYAHPID